MNVSQLHEAETGGKLPPHSTLAERSLLGGLMLDNSAWRKVSTQVAETDFYHKKHALIFRAISRLAKEGVPFDTVTLSERMETDRELDAAGGLSFLAIITQDTPSAANIFSYARIVADRARSRRMIEELHTAEAGLYAGKEGSVEALQEALERLTRTASTNRHFTKPNPIGYERLFAADPHPPPVLISGTLPREAFGLVGPGGAAKTTLTLWLMVHVVLGRKVFGRPVDGPGNCVFVSAEDPDEIIDYRVRQICDALYLSEDERHKVAQGMHVHDATGKLMRYVEADEKGNLRITEAVDQLIETYQDADIQLCVMDPATFFGPGERFINDAESALMQAAQRISKGLGGAAVGYLHHTGKAAARGRHDRPVRGPWRLGLRRQLPFAAGA